MLPPAPPVPPPAEKLAPPAPPPAPPPPPPPKLVVTKLPLSAPGLPMKPVPPAPPGWPLPASPPAPPSASAGQQNAASHPTMSRALPNPRGAGPATAPRSRKSEYECATSSPRAIGYRIAGASAKSIRRNSGPFNRCAATRGRVAAVFMRCSAEATDRSGRRIGFAPFSAGFRTPGRDCTLAITAKWSLKVAARSAHCNLVALETGNCAMKDTLHARREQRDARRQVEGRPW